MENHFYLGIDLDDWNAVVSYYELNMREPETFSATAGSEVFQIPVAIAKKRGIDQWLVGEEARRLAETQGERAHGFCGWGDVSGAPAAGALSEEIDSAGGKSQSTEEAGYAGDLSGEIIQGYGGAFLGNCTGAWSCGCTVDVFGPQGEFLLFCLSSETGVEAA